MPPLFTSVPVQTIHTNSKTKAKTGQHSPTKNQHVHSHKSHPYWIFYLTHTYFLFQGKYYEQVQGAAMGSPISPPHSKHLHWKSLKSKPSIPFPYPPFGSGWLMTPLSSQGRTQFTYFQHINNQNPHIQFHSGTNTTRLTSLPGHSCHHKTRQHLQHHSIQETHPITDQYLHWDSNHHITSKQSVFNTLAHRAKTVSSSGENGQGTSTHQNSTTTLPVSFMGPQPVATQVHPSQPAVHQHHQHLQQKQHSRQQQKQGHHCSTIHTQHR